MMEKKRSICEILKLNDKKLIVAQIREKIVTKIYFKRVE